MALANARPFLRLARKAERRPLWIRRSILANRNQPATDIFCHCSRLKRQADQPPKVTASRQISASSRFCGSEIAYKTTIKQSCCFQFLGGNFWKRAPDARRRTVRSNRFRPRSLHQAKKC